MAIELIYRWCCATQTSEASVRVHRGTSQDCCAIYIFLYWRDVGILDFGIQGGRYIHRVILCDVIVTHHSSVGGSNFSDLEARVDVRRGTAFTLLALQWRCDLIIYETVIYKF